MDLKVSEYIAEEMSKVTDAVFLLTGGGAMFLNDAFSWHENLKPIFCHHEQSCAMAAEAYARSSGKIGFVNVTTGPGVINALNGVFGAFTDSIPMIVISGQVKTTTTLRSNGLLGKLRQLGDQEVDATGIVDGITKEAIYVSSPSEIPFVLKRAISECQSGRPGPVWIDVPIDIQSSEIDPERFHSGVWDDTNTVLRDAASKVRDKIEKSRRPLFLIGSGIYRDNSLQELENLTAKLGVPISTAWTAIDAVDFEDALYAERSGVVGTRAGNIILQMSDLIIVLGSRLPIRQVSYNFENFGKNASIVYVDIDEFELCKPMVQADLMIQAKIIDFLKELALACEKLKLDTGSWLAKIKEVRDAFPLSDVELGQGNSGDKLNPYHFLAELFESLNETDIVVAADASASVMAFQVAKPKKGQRIFTNAGSASMGYEFPAAIGAAVANPDLRVICLAGDGSSMLNIQELETIVRYNLNVKIFCLANDGYLSIKQSQDNFFGRRKGVNKESGLNFLDFQLVCESAGLKYSQVHSADGIPALQKLLSDSGPIFVEVIVDPGQGFAPKLGSRQLENGSIVSNSLEYMSPELESQKINKFFEE